MKKILILLFFLSCSHAPPGPESNSYHVLIFSLKAGDTRIKMITACDPYSLKYGRKKVEMAVADFTNQGMYCQQNRQFVDYECTSNFKMVKAVLVQGKRECENIPGDTLIKERRSL